MKNTTGMIGLAHRFYIDNKNDKRVERRLYGDGELIYKDDISIGMFSYLDKHPDAIMAIERFCFGRGGPYPGSEASKEKPTSDATFTVRTDGLVPCRSPLGFLHRITRRIRNWRKLRQ